MKVVGRSIALETYGIYRALEGRELFFINVSNPYNKFNRNLSVDIWSEFGVVNIRENKIKRGRTSNSRESVRCASVVRWSRKYSV